MGCSALFKLVFSHPAFLMLSFCSAAFLSQIPTLLICFFTLSCLLFHSDPFFYIYFFYIQSCLCSFIDTSSVMLERLLTVAAHCRGQMWQIIAQSFELCPLTWVSVSLSLNSIQFNSIELYWHDCKIAQYCQSNSNI